MQEFAITNDKTKRPVALRTKTLADLLECEFPVLSVRLRKCQTERKEEIFIGLYEKLGSSVFSHVSAECAG